MEIWSWCPILDIKKCYVISSYGRIKSVPRGWTGSDGRMGNVKSRDIKITLQNQTVMKKTGATKIQYGTVKLKNASKHIDIRIALYKLVAYCFGGEIGSEQLQNTSGDVLNNATWNISDRYGNVVGVEPPLEEFMFVEPDFSSFSNIVEPMYSFEAKDTQKIRQVRSEKEIHEMLFKL